MTKEELMKAIKIEDNKIIIKGIDLSNMSIKIDENIGGNLKTLDIGGYNEQGRIGDNNRQGYIAGDNYQKNIGGHNGQLDIGGNNLQGDIGGNNGQGNINGNNRQVYISGNNRQWDIGGDNQQRHINGDNEQRNIGGGNYQGDIGGNNFQKNIGGHSRNSKHYINDEKGIATVDMDYTDGILLHSTKVRKLKGGLEYIEGLTRWEQTMYLVKTPNISYHSWKSLEDAKNGFRKKKKRLLEGLGEWVKTLTDDTIITRELFHEETGSCMPGINAWCKKVGISEDTKEITFKEFKEHATNHPTRETKQVMIVLEELKGEK